VISNGQDLFLTGYKTLYELRPGIGQAVNGIIEKPSEPSKTKAGGKKKGTKEK
jgi:hypothetical protein